MVRVSLALALLLALGNVAACEAKHGTRRATYAETKRTSRRNARMQFRATWHGQVDKQRAFMAAVRRAFTPRHQCILVLCLTLMEAPLSRLVRDAPLPVVICRQNSGACGAALRCRGIFVLAGAYHEAAAAAAGSITPSSSQSSVLLVTASRALPPARDVQELDRAEAALCAWPRGECWRLTGPHRHPRLWQPDGAPDEMREARQRVDFHGRNLRVATFHQPPLVYIDDHNDLKNVHGTEWAVLRMLAEHLNFTWSVVLADQRDHFGKPEGNSSWRGGTLGAVVSGDADLSLNVWVQLDQSRVVDLTSYTRISCLTFMVPRPHALSSTADAVFQPLQEPVWAAWLLSIVVATLAARLLDAAARLAGLPAPEGFRSLLRCFQLLLGVAVVAYVPPSRPSLGPQRHLIAWWVMYSVLMTTAFSSGLIAHLTMQFYEAPVNSAQDIVDRKLTWASSFVPNFQVMLNLENASERKLAEGMKVIDAASWESTVASGKYVVQGQKMDKSYFFWVGGNLGANTLRKMRLMKSCLVHYPVAIALRKGSPLLAPFSRAISRIREAGLIGYWQSLVVRERGRPAVVSLFIDAMSREGPQVLKLAQLKGAFTVLLYGLCIAAAAFLLENFAPPPEMHLKTG